MRAFAKTVPFEGESIRQFLKGFRSEATKDSYTKKLSYFLEYVKIRPDEFLERTKQDPRWAEHMIIDYVEARRNQVSGSTISQLRDALKHFYAMNDYENGINWGKIAMLMPRAKKVGSDRAPTVDEVRKMVENSDLRMKCIILLLASSGIRVGAIDYLRWGDIEPFLDGNEVVAARFLVYRGDPEEYEALVTPECFQALMEYKKRRESMGEVVSPSSPLIRDNWDTRKYDRKKVDPKMARPLSSLTVRNDIRLLLWNIGLRNSAGKHEFKAVHGFRKFFKTQAERVMKTIDVEKLLGHAENYYKPGMDYILQEYRKAIPYLTISESVVLKDRLNRRTEDQDKKVGELERMNLTLQERLMEMEGKIKELTEFVVSKNANLSRPRASRQTLAASQ